MAWNRKHRRIVELEARVAELEAKLADAREDAQRLARQVVDLTARAEKLAGDVKFAKRVGAHHHENAEMLRSDVRAAEARLEAALAHVDLLVRVGGYGMKHAAPSVRSEWADAVRGVSRRDEHGNFIKAAS